MFSLLIEVQAANAAEMPIKLVIWLTAKTMSQAESNDSQTKDIANFN